MADEAPAQDSTLRLETAAKIAALCGILIYGGLFLAYQRFYGAFGIQPEDVGVNQIFILSRSIALIPQAGWVVIGFVALCTIVPRSWPLCLIMLACAVVFGLLSCVWSTVSGVSSIVVFVPSILALTAPVPSQARAKMLVATVTVIAAVSAESYYVWNQAAGAATAVRAGYAVGPLQAHLLPIIELEVSADWAKVTWVGPPAQRPADLFPDATSPTATMILLGQNATTVFLVTYPAGQARINRLPLANVAVTS
jgi:hypothetical protein